ncbi:MAG TPA: alkaline phosphatase [Candidatus Polarisedimenticolaceae bacterium]|nr:alkaline phosphatase [Candidatus Polarisedimenticolaceae bacterium]
MRAILFSVVLATSLLVTGCGDGARPAERPTETLRGLQLDATRGGRPEILRWGPDPQRSVSWHHHSNRLIPVYAFGTRGGGDGLDLDTVGGASSVYRARDALAALYGRHPERTLNARADYFDQTDIARIQRAGVAAGKRYLFLVVFDGMDWQTTRAASIYRTGEVRYDRGRGSGLHFQDYDASGSSQFGFMVTSPANDRTAGDPGTQRVSDRGSGLYGGYDASRGGAEPWDEGPEPAYVIAEDFSNPTRHAYTDSAAAATSMCSGIKTYSAAVNVDTAGRQQLPIARELQQRGFGVGVVTDVPISHATPAAAYANNVVRHDYQDLSRDMLGLPSIAHPRRALAGLDVLIGCGAGVERATDAAQGDNYVPGNRYLASDDLRAIDEAGGGDYVVVVRERGTDAGRALEHGARRAAERGLRLFGFFGTTYAHLPYRTADGGHDPVEGQDGQAERYSAADLVENPTLAEMTAAALVVLGSRAEGFWLMVEAGDVDWANHDANIDAAVGSVLSGDEAVRVITDWVETHSDWTESLLVVTADHGHYPVLVDPERFASFRP